MTIIYRYRPMHNLIGEYRELEKQELVLSSPRQFNDPLEGYQDVFWEGDEVLWENLLRHYLLNLHWAAVTCALFDDETFDESAIEPKLTPDDLPSDEWRRDLGSVYHSFFEEKGFGRIPSTLASLPKPLRRKSLQRVFSVIHGSALGSVLERLRTSGMTPGTWPRVTNSADSETVVEMLNELSAAMADETEAQWIDSMTSQVGSVKSHKILQETLQGGVENLELHKKKEILLFSSFPNRYIKQICDSLIHTDWHILCFAKKCTSPPMWATYANEHRGAALMFQTDREYPLGPDSVNAFLSA